jgi:hypothetical protein
VSGARTATELALIQNELHTRLASRQGKVDWATTDVAEKIIFLGAKFTKGKKRIQRAGVKEWVTIARKDLNAVKVGFDVVPYSPLENNRAVVEERFFKALEYMQSRADDFDWEEIDAAFIEMFHLNPKMLKARDLAVAGAQPTAKLPPEVADMSLEEQAAAAKQGISPDQIAAEIRSQAVNQPDPNAVPPTPATTPPAPRM